MTHLPNLQNTRGIPVLDIPPVYPKTWDFEFGVFPIMGILTNIPGDIKKYFDVIAPEPINYPTFSIDLDIMEPTTTVALKYITFEFKIYRACQNINTEIRRTWYCHTAFVKEGREHIHKLIDTQYFRSIPQWFGLSKLEYLYDCHD